MSTLRPVLTFAALCVTVVLGGCGGFTPLYAAQGVSPKLAAIEVTQPDGRLGFYMREYLEDSLARDRNQPAVYRLSIANRELRVPRGITISNVASRYEVDLSTTYTLTEIATGKQVTRGIVSVNVTYDVQTQPYASLAAQQDGERRVAEQAADRLRIELATYFASPRPTPPASALVPIDQSAYSDRLAGAVVQSPRQQATGDLQPQGQNDVFGQTRSLTTTPQTAQPFTPSQDPNNPAPAPAPDPNAIKTLPEDGSSGQ
jgi:LPS-assembly lipoprotein